MNDFDVVIVGAGPAGCAAAYDLCDQHRSVLILDKAEFPRLKPCGGGLTIKALRALRYSVRPVIRRFCSNLVVGNAWDHQKLLRSREPVCALTVRTDLDDYSLQQTIRAGARFQRIHRLVDLHERANGIALETDQGTVTGDYLIGADGANSRVRKLAGLERGHRTGFGLESNLFLDKKSLDALPMEFDFGIVKRGYGWLFPKDDHVNVGVYTNSTSVKVTRQTLREYVHKRLGLEIGCNVVGHRMGMGGWNTAVSSRRVLLTGDAAGLVEPLLGEGIYNAIRSGQEAAYAVSQALNCGAPVARVYQRRLRPIRRDLLSAYHASTWFYGRPGLGFRALTFPVTRYSLMKGFSLGLTFRETQRKFFLLPLMRVSASSWPETADSMCTR